MNIHIDSRIQQLQSHGGITRLWRALLPELKAALPEATWDAERSPDLFMSTYYAPAPAGVRSIVLCYDFVNENYAPIGAHHIDAVAKRAAIAQADAVIAISQQTARDCLTFCGKPATVAYCGGSDYTRALPDAAADFRQRYQLNQPYVLIVGRRGLYKNVRTLYQAWPLWNGAAQHQIVCIGGEPPDADDQRFMQQYPGAWRQISLPDSDMPAAYTGATALVYPSLYEGFGLPIVEALSCGCPVITAQWGSMQEVGGKAVTVCNPLLPMELAQALEQVSEPEYRLARILEGYQQARKFRWSDMAQTVASVIRGVA